MPKKRLLAAAVTLALGVPTFHAQAQSVGHTALPTGAQVVAGQAAISQNGAAMRIDQSSTRAALDWQSFNIGAGASVTFNQPSSSAIALNRVLGAGGSEIYGRLSANGQVFLVNPNGVLFARGAQVDVGGLVASTLGMSTDDFMLGRYSLRAQGAAGSLVNQGTIRAQDGSVALVAPSVTNEGLIEAQGGTISLTAASAATVDLMADGLVRIRVDEGALQAEIANNGILRADGGSIALSARAVDNLARAVVNNTGIIEARSVEAVNGVVRLSGGDVYVSGTIDVSSAEGSGGSAHVLGERVALVGNARIDASGALGGGEVLIGGDAGGRNPGIRNAQYTYIGPDAAVLADARFAGDGGKLIAWADDVTRVYGKLSVRGGTTAGDGGFVETSGKRYLDAQQAPDLRAPAGRAGTWLLDPETINIDTGLLDVNVTSLSPFQPVLVGTSLLTVGTLNAALDQGGTVIVDTTNLLGLGAGDININAPITKSSGADAALELRAHNNININQSITSSNNRLDLLFNADQDGQGGGVVNIASNVTLNSAGGTINASAETVNIGTARIVAPLFSAGTLNLSPGTLTLTGNVNVAGALNWSGGVMTGAGTTLVGGPLAITGSVGLDAGRVLDVQGNAGWSAGSINLNAGNAAGAGTIVNRAIFSMTSDGSIITQDRGVNDDGTSALFDNRGTLQKSAGAGASSIQSRLLNRGVIQVGAGTLQASDFPRNDASIVLANDATFATGGNALINLAGAVIQGNGTFDLGSATLTNRGTIRPGASPGTLDIRGGLTLANTSVVDIEVSGQGTTAGRDFDLINVTSGASLNGTLNIVHLGASAPPPGQHMAIINAGSVKKDFSAVSAPASSAGYAVLYGPGSVTIALSGSVSGTVGFEPATVATTSAPSAAAVSEASAPAASLVALSARAPFVLPDFSHIAASLAELRRKKVDAVENAVRILERNPGAADLPPCVGEPSGNCIVQRPARLEPRESAPARTPELAYLRGIERKVALLIGVNEYPHPIPQLGSPLKDIAEIAALYRSQFGYEVRTLPNADKATIVREVNRLILETGPNDSVVLFYAGHGHVVEKTGRGYWIPGNASGDDPAQWISNSDIAKMLANMPARQVLLVSDSCYSGTLAREARVEKSEVLADPQAVLERRAVTVLTSGGDEPVADAGKDGHSVFAWHFMRALRRVAQWASGVDVYERLAEAVQLEFPQQPQYGAALGAGHEPGADYLFEVRRY